MAKSPPDNGENSPPQRMTSDRACQITPQERAAYERWEKNWAERRENPDEWERRRAEELQSARLAREAQEAKSRAAWAILVHRPPWERDSFRLDEISRNVRVPGQAGCDDAASDRILIQLFASLLHHDFDGNVLIWSDERPHLIPFDPEKARWLQELDLDIDATAIRTLGFAGLLFLPRAVCKRWCEHNGLVLPPEWISQDAGLPNGLTEEPDIGRNATVTLATDDDKIEPKRPGPKKGTGRYAAADRELFPDIKKSMVQGATLHGAVSQIAERIAGNSQEDSRIRRVERRYRKEVLRKK